MPVEYRVGLQAVRECSQGKPLLFMRTFFRVLDKRTGLAVPFVPMPNQERIYQETFGKYACLTEGFDVAVWKARKAFVTTLVEYCLMALQMVNENYDALDASDSDDTNKSILKMWDVVYDNLPEPLFVLPESAPENKLKREIRFLKPRKGLWNTEQRGFVFGEERQQDGKTIFDQRASSITYFSSYKTHATGRSFTPAMILRHEWAHAAPEDAPAFEQAVQGSRRPGASVKFDESSGNGPETLHYQSYKDWRDHATNLIGIIVYWYQDQTNSLKETSNFVIAQDKGMFPLTEEEQAVRSLPDFPTTISEEIVRDMFRWRRYEMRMALSAALGDTGRAKSVFRQEHMERESDIGIAARHSPIQDDVRAELEAGIVPPLSVSMVAPAFWQSIWRHRVPGHRYIGLMDPAHGVGKDACACKVYDADMDMEVAEIYGQAHPKTATEAFTRLLQHYGPEGDPAWFVWENNLAKDIRDIALECGFPAEKLYRRRLKPGENPESAAYLYREWGWNTNVATKRAMLPALVQRLNEGGLRTPSKSAVGDLLSYNFEENYEKTVSHTPNRVICDALYVMVRDELVPIRLVGGRGKAQEAVVALPTRLARAYGGR